MQDSIYTWLTIFTRLLMGTDRTARNIDTSCDNSIKSDKFVLRRRVQFL